MSSSMAQHGLGVEITYINLHTFGAQLYQHTPLKLEDGLRGKGFDDLGRRGELANGFYPIWWLCQYSKNVVVTNDPLIANNVKSAKQTFANLTQADVAICGLAMPVSVVVRRRA